MHQIGVASHSQFSPKTFGRKKKVCNFASMKKEFGKWLMDIAKYMVTALLLSTIFADMDNSIIVYIVVILSAIVLGFGLYWVNEGEKDYKKKGKKK